MKLYGSLSRLVSILFRKDSQDITVRPNQATTYTASRDIQLPPGDAAHVLMSANSVATMTNKTFDADGAGNSISNIENADIKSGAAIDAAKIHDGSVSNTEFGYIGGLTSDAQTQLNARVVGPASATDEAIARYDSTTGKLIQDSAVTISDAGVMSGATQLNVDNLRLDGNSLSSTDTDGNVVLDPNGTGAVQVSQANLLLQSGTSASELRFYEPSGSGSNYSSFKAQAQAGDVNYTLPAAAPTSNGQVLSGTTAGVLSWVDQGAGFDSFAADWLNADGASKVITHNLGTKDVQVEIYDEDDDSTIWIDSIVRTDANSVTLTSSEAPAVSWRVTIHAV